MSRRQPFADGSVTGKRVEAAVVRALDAYMTIERKADLLIEELDDVTIPGVVRTQIDQEDSLVIAIKDVITHDAS